MNDESNENFWMLITDFWAELTEAMAIMDFEIPWQREESDRERDRQFELAGFL